MYHVGLVSVFFPAILRHGRVLICIANGTSMFYARSKAVLVHRLHHIQMGGSRYVSGCIYRMSGCLTWHGIDENLQQSQVSICHHSSHERASNHECIHWSARGTCLCARFCVTRKTSFSFFILFILVFQQAWSIQPWGEHS